MSNFIEDILSADAFWIVNKKLMRLLGADAAILLAFLTSKRKYYRSIGQLNAKGGFFALADDIEEELGISRKIREGALKTLAAHGLLLEEREGVPARKYFYIQDSEITSFLIGPKKEVVGGEQYVRNEQSRSHDSCNLSHTLGIKNKEIKNKEKKEKKKKEKPAAVAVDPEVFALAERWAIHAKSKKAHLQPDVEKYAAAIGKAMTYLKCDVAALKEAFLFAETHWLWSEGALTPIGLMRNSTNGLKKIDNLVSAMGWDKKQKPAQKREKASTYQSNDNSGFENEATF